MKRQTRGSDASWDQLIRGGRKSGRYRGPRGALRIGSYVLVVVVVLAILAGAAIFYAQWKFERSATDVATDSRTPSEPMNVLILGSDTRDVLTKEQKKSFGDIGGKRADTIMLLHLDEKRQKAVLLHFPRDLRVTYPDGKVGKINAAYDKGAENIIETVKDFTGLPIAHYVEVDFRGFNKIVNKLGGVDVYFDKPIKDADSGLDVPKGCVTVKGDQALAFVRVRKIDDDFGRIARQQLFVRLMMDKVVKPTTVLNPIKVVQLVNLFTANVKRDAELSLGDVKNIAFRLRGFDSTKVDMRVIPSSGARIRGVSYVVANEQQSEALFTAIKERRPLPEFGRTGVSSVEPADIKVTVLNGTDVAKLARTEANNLHNKGFVVLGTAGTSPHKKTTVYYEAGNEEKARFVAGNYAAAQKLMTPQIKALRAGSEIVLVVGEDYAAGKATPPPPPPVSGKGSGKAPQAPIRECAE